MVSDLVEGKVDHGRNTLLSNEFLHRLPTGSRRVKNKDIIPLFCEGVSYPLTARFRRAERGEGDGRRGRPGALFCFLDHTRKREGTISEYSSRYPV